MLYEHVKEKENVEKRTQVLYWGGLVFPLHFWKDNTSEVGQWHMLSVSITKNNNNKKNICRVEKFNSVTNGDNSGVRELWKYASLFLLNKCACISSSYRNDYQHTHTHTQKNNQHLGLVTLSLHFIQVDFLWLLSEWRYGEVFIPSANSCCVVPGCFLQVCMRSFVLSGRLYLYWN